MINLNDIDDYDSNGFDKLGRKESGFDRNGFDTYGINNDEFDTTYKSIYNQSTKNENISHVSNDERKFKTLSINTK